VQTKSSIAWSRAGRSRCHEFQPHPQIESEIVVRCEIVPIDRRVIHEINAEGGTLAADRRREARARKGVPQAALDPFAKPPSMLVDFVAVHRQAF
jgi:hypothetical protein